MPVVDAARNIYFNIMFWVLLFSLPINLLAAYFSATNDRLSLPIRLFTTTESCCKVIYAAPFVLYSFCQLPFIE
ncbi:unnamed protein product, partial [Mesorhabditis belari]|uniref:Uncharacterized protein n=1 Tax=Mesorhabditis belari TaxID=2138241 RepID=A0AAF3FBH5_9BILA